MQDIYLYLNREIRGNNYYIHLLNSVKWFQAGIFSIYISDCMHKIFCLLEKEYLK